MNKTKKIIIVLLALINGIVLYNAIFHDPNVGYDAPAHIKNIKVISEFRFPEKGDTYLYYMPPLCYLLPAILHSLKLFSFDVILKFAQLLNFIWSIGVTVCLLRICELLRPRNDFFKVLSLATLGIMPVYYKTFAFIRAEPLLTFLVVCATYLMLKIFVHNFFNLRYVILLGICIGLSIITKPIGLFLIPMVFIFVVLIGLRNKKHLLLFLKFVFLVLLISFFIGGWFYIRNYLNYGTFVKYNNPVKMKLSFSNLPKKFYFGLGDGYLFTNPVRESFDKQFLPTWHSDFWGDYWCYFIVYGRDVLKDKYIIGNYLRDYIYEQKKRPEVITNYFNVQNYLGSVNVFCLFPSFLMILGFILSLDYLFNLFSLNHSSKMSSSFGLIGLAVVISFLFYFSFLIRYPATIEGDTVKPSYMLHVFPFVAILTGEVLNQLRTSFPLGYKLTIFYLLFVFVYIFPVFITRYNLPSLF